MSQGDYPIKGLHIAIEGLAILKRRYPDVHLYITGKNPLDRATIRSKISISSYERYIKRLLVQYDLINSVFFLGNLNATDMIEQYQKAHVFIMPSLVENSPNSLMEAMSIGTPCVASFTGGIPSIANDREDALLFPICDFEGMAGCISELFENDNFAKKLSMSASCKMNNINNLKDNISMLLEGYNTILYSID